MLFILSFASSQKAESPKTQKQITYNKRERKAGNTGRMLVFHGCVCVCFNGSFCHFLRTTSRSSRRGDAASSNAKPLLRTAVRSEIDARVGEERVSENEYGTGEGD